MVRECGVTTVRALPGLSTDLEALPGLKSRPRLVAHFANGIDRRVESRRGVLE